MRLRKISCCLFVLLALASLEAQVRVSRTSPAPNISRELLIDQATVQVVRSTYNSGAIEPPGPHAFDVVIVPLTQGSVRIEIAGKAVAWKIGEPIFIPRRVEHSITNAGKTSVKFLSVRIP